MNRICSAHGSWLTLGRSRLPRSCSQRIAYNTLFSASRGTGLRSMLGSERWVDLETFVETNTAATANHSLTPQLRLRLITPACDLYSATEQDLADLKTTKGIDVCLAIMYSHSAPFWGFWWPGGQSLAKYVFDQPQLVCGKAAYGVFSECPDNTMQRVLDLGAGGGGVGIAAKLMGAAHVCVNDIDSTALVAAHLNAELNGAGVDEYCVDSLIGTTSQADICYDAEFAAMALRWLQEQVSLGTQVLIGDPGRAYLPRTGHALTLLHTYRLPDAVEEENHGLVSGGVYAVNSS